MSGGAFAANFADWCNTDITVEHWIGTFNVDGTPIRSAGVAMKCLLVEKVRMVRDTQGNERSSMATLYIMDGPFSPQDRITMPASFVGGNQPPILNVSNYTDKDGSFDHSEVYL